jgi:hypothetical protein
MRHFVAISAVAGLAALVAAGPASAFGVPGMSPAATNPTTAIERAGCVRLGETGYHWYRFCVGPSFLYPHYRSEYRGREYGGRDDGDWRRHHRYGGGEDWRNRHRHHFDGGY